MRALFSITTLCVLAGIAGAMPRVPYPPTTEVRSLDLKQLTDKDIAGFVGYGKLESLTVKGEYSGRW
jgi:hypothetical protein